MVNELKRKLSILLIISMVFTNDRILTFASSVGEMLNSAQRLSFEGKRESKISTIGEIEEDEYKAEYIGDIAEDFSDGQVGNNEEYEEYNDDITDNNISTTSDVADIDLDTSSQSLEDKFKEEVATTSSTNFATYSEIKLDKQLLGSIASFSELKAKVASHSELFGATNNNVNINHGQKIYFGNYKQANENATDPIEWRVLTVENNKAFLLAERILDVRSFGNTTSYTASEIKNWLDNTFYNTAFNEYERNAIVNTWHMDTLSNDNVFLLNKDELFRYNHTHAKTHKAISDGTGLSFWTIWQAAWQEFLNLGEADNYDALLCKASNYAYNITSPKPLLANRNEDKEEAGASYHAGSYWLRSTITNIFGTYVQYLDYTLPSGIRLDPVGFSDPDRKHYVAEFGIRPATYIDLTSSYFNGKQSNIRLDYNGGKYIGESTYQYMNSYREGVKTQLPMVYDVVPPNSKLELAGWIYNTNQTEPLFYITPDTIGDITAKAVWKNKHYNITWDLKDDRIGVEGSWDGTAAPTHYEVNVGLELPTNVIAPMGEEFDFWEIDGKKTNSISANEERDITIKARYKNKKYNINYDLVDDDTGLPGHFDGDYYSYSQYEFTVNKDLPRNVIAPTGKAFDHWEIAGIATTSIVSGNVGDITVKAAYTDTIWFGVFPQNDKEGKQKEPIKWRIVSVDGNIATCVTDKIIYSMPFGDGIKDEVLWYGTPMYNWLQDVFRDTAISLEQFAELGSIEITTKEGANKDVRYSDKIALLTIEEIRSFVNNYSLMAKVTEYAKSSGRMNVDEDGFSHWWLRSASIDTTYKDTISNKGYKDLCISANVNYIGVRPTIYINLDSNMYKKSNNHITLELNGGSWKENSKLWEEFDTYQGGQRLPDASNIIPPNNDTFLGWVIRGENNFITEIPLNQTGDIVLEAVYGSVWFGTYPQGDATGVQKEPIKWNILKKEGDNALFVSDKVLDNISFNNSLTSVTWENSDIRNWLSNSFKDKAFTYEQFNDGIAIKNISTLNQNDTEDKLFLLSNDEANNYYKNDDDRRSKATEYAKNVDNAGSRLTASSDGYGEYWLRTKGVSITNSAQYVFTNGAINRSGVYVNNHTIGVRPAFYAKLNSDIFRISNNKITWDLNGGSWKKESGLWGEMISYQGAQKLPTSENLVPPENQKFLGWSYYGETATISEIAASKTGNIILVANWSNHPYNITWDLMDIQTGVEGSWVGEKGPDQYIYGVGLPTLPTNAVSNDAHRIFDHFEVLDSSSPSSITKKDTGNKIIVAIYINKDYDIIWDLEDGNTGNKGTWNGDHITTYEYSVGIPTLPTNVIGPTGREFDHWEINGKTATSIGETDDGTITVKAVYKNKIYNVYWSLGEGKWKDNYKAVTTYEYSVGTQLPGGDRIVAPNGKSFSNWLVRFDGDPITYELNNIGSTAYGDAEVIAAYDNVTYNLTYQDENGLPITWAGGVSGPATYTYQTGIPHLPTNVVAVGENEFDHWEINNLIVTGIAPTAYGDKIVIAMYKKKQYKITWQLSNDELLPGHVIEGDWNGKPGKDTYTFGSTYTLPKNINPPSGFVFEMWQREDGTEIREISSKDTGPITIKAIYRSIIYKINWNLNGAVVDDTLLRPDYAYGDTMLGPLYIPDLKDPTFIQSVPESKIVSHWAVNGVRATEIPKGMIGDLNITLVYKGEDVHKITWDYGVGENHWEFVGWIPPATFSEGIPVSIPDATYLYKTPNGREIDYFTVNGIEALEIDTNIDVVVAAVLKDSTYRIKYNLFDGAWDGDEGADIYTHNHSYTLPTNIIAPRGQQFSHWEIDGVVTTSIVASDYGHKEFNAVYETATYRIYWGLKGATVTGDMPSEYTYGTIVNLPDASRVTAPGNKIFDYWTINGVRATSIDSMFAEDVAVVITYVSYSITWDLGGGRFNYYSAQSLYEKGTEVILPLSNYVIPPKNKIFDYWTVNGVRAAKISDTNVGAVNIQANYKLDPTPTPTPSPKPYYPTNGGGSGSGGGGGGGGSLTLQNPIVNINKLNILKTAAQTYDANNVVWTYDPVLNKFKINIRIGSEVISMVDGLCNISRIDIKNINGTNMQIPTIDTYCFKDGNMLTGWVGTIDGKWYFFENMKNVNEGKMYTGGWKLIQDKWYYFLQDGSMLANAMTPDGYQVGLDGAMVNIAKQ